MTGGTDMTVKQLAAQAGLKILAGEGSLGREIESVYSCDLLSFVMGRAPADSAWVTVMGNVNAVAVASLADAALIVLCHDAALMEDARARAAEQGINIALTGLPEFEAAVAVAGQLGLR